MKPFMVLMLLPISTAFAVPFVPGQGGRNDLVKAVIASVESNVSVQVQFNPKEIPIEKTVPWQKHANSEGDAPTLEFTSAEPKTMSVELMFDTFEDRASVYDAYIQKLEQLTLVGKETNRPPLVTFTWGSSFPVFKGVIESLAVKYTMFLPDGTPCRATVNLRMRQAEKLMNHREAQSCSTDMDCAGGETCQSGSCSRTH